MSKFERVLFTATPMVITFYLLLTSMNLEMVLISVAVSCFVSHLKFLEDEIDKLR